MNVQKQLETYEKPEIQIVEMEMDSVVLTGSQGSMTPQGEDNGIEDFGNWNVW